jgi:hypothetical protein
MNKRIAPTVILIVLVFFILLQVGGLVFALTQEGIGLFWKILVVAVPLIFIIALFTVYMERIREIDEEENDDLSKY